MQLFFEMSEPKEINKKSILIVVNSYAPQMETFIYNHIKNIQETHLFSVEVACINFPDKEFTVDKSIEITHLNLSICNRIIGAVKVFFKNPFQFFKLSQYGRVSKNLSVFEVYNKLAHKEFDIIHCHFGQNGNLLAPLVALQLIKGRFVTQFHGLDITLPVCKEKGYYAALQSTINVALTNTQFSKNKLLELGFKNDIINTIPVGTDTHFFTSSKQTKSSVFTIIFIGRLIPLKGVTLLPEIDQILQKQIGDNFEIIVVGNGPLREDLEKYNNVAIKSNITLLGRLSIEEVFKALERSDVLLYPGYSDEQGREETQGLIIQEAMSMALPVVVTDVGGVAEAVENNITGFVTSQKDVLAIVSKLRFFYENKEITSQMGKNAQQFVKKNYDLKITNNRILKEIYLIDVDLY